MRGVIHNESTTGVILDGGLGGAITRLPAPVSTGPEISNFIVFCFNQASGLIELINPGRGAADIYIENASSLPSKTPAPTAILKGGSM